MTITRACTALLAGVLLLAPLTGSAQDPTTDSVEIVRDGLELQDALIRPRPDVDFTDSALVFTNTSRRTSYVRCVGYNRNGGPVGRIWLKVPAAGLRFVFASDLSNGVDFIGSASCWARGAVWGSAFLLAPSAVTDLPSHQLPIIRRPVIQTATGAVADITIYPTPSPFVSRVRFPVVASY